MQPQMQKSVQSLTFHKSHGIEIVTRVAVSSNASVGNTIYLLTITIFLAHHLHHYQSYYFYTRLMSYSVAWSNSNYQLPHQYEHHHNK